jgi:hypothetical protein
VIGGLSGIDSSREEKAEVMHDDEFHFIPSVTPSMEVPKFLTIPANVIVFPSTEDARMIAEVVGNNPFLLGCLG